MRANAASVALPTLLLGLALTPEPAHAGAGDTIISFTVGTTGSTVSIAPGAYVPGTGSANTAVGTIVSVVNDLRTTSGSWTDTVSSTDFTLVGATSPTGTALIPASSAKIWSPTTVVTIPGTATVSNTHTSLASALTLSNAPATLLQASTTNANTTTLTSNVQIDTTGKATGIFTGTVTQTVS